MEKVLNNDFENISDWSVDNKLSSHSGEHKKPNRFSFQVNVKSRIYNKNSL